MAGLIHTALKRLLPAGRSMKSTGQLSLVFEALADTIERPNAYIGNVRREAIAGSAVDTVDDWLALLGIGYTDGMSTGDKARYAAAEIASLGGQSLDYINERVQFVFSNVNITELTIFTYSVDGFINFSAEYARLFSILRRIAPLHLSPVYNVRSVYDGDVARCRIASTGRAICGRRTTAYAPTDGQIARSAIGVAGVAVTGRVPA